MLSGLSDSVLVLIVFLKIPGLHSVDRILNLFVKYLDQPVNFPWSVNTHHFTYMGYFRKFSITSLTSMISIEMIEESGSMKISCVLVPKSSWRNRLIT
ncbi:hypothetical protein SAMN06297164_2753 [Nitrosomonas ureae]|uniref:Uncharacterized protein n=1 Tax=Nitrosomonas ureae TaxID=44577 RepID=A0A286AFN2_9PROT|nr:hypothetical protein SAMN06297164_2753 [Nitrosomonas ureae]